MDETNKGEREALLFRLWKAQAEALEAKLKDEAGTVSAATLREVRAFLRDSGVDHEAMPGGRHAPWMGQALLSGPLPDYSADDEEDEAFERELRHEL